MTERDSVFRVEKHRPGRLRSRFGVHSAERRSLTIPCAEFRAGVRKRPARQPYVNQAFWGIAEKITSRPILVANTRQAVSCPEPLRYAGRIGEVQ